MLDQRFWAIVGATALLFFSSTGWAQQQPDDPQADEQQVEQLEQQQDDPVQDPQQPDEPAADLSEPYGVGTTDLMVSGSLFGVFGGYLTVQPGLELGMIPLGEGITLGVGGELDAGWCALCGLLALTPVFDSLSAWYASPRGRATVHFNQLSEALDMSGLDAYVGLVAGPALYSVDMNFAGGGRAEGRILSFIIGPVFGARITTEGTTGFFIFGEGRFHSEFGRSTVTVTIEGDEDEEVFVAEGGGATSRGGLDTFVGLGFRF